MSFPFRVVRVEHVGANIKYLTRDRIIILIFNAYIEW